jgi:hypothetical protein
MRPITCCWRTQGGRAWVAILGFGALAWLPFEAAAATPEELLARYEREARAEAPAFHGFSAEEGRAFYLGKHPVPVIGEVGCVSCHLQDPRRSVMRHRTKIPCRACHVINDAEHVDPVNAKKREIDAFAPVANPHSFTDPEIVEKWFQLNCDYVLKRSCTAVEKGNLLAWLLSLQRGEMDNKPELGKEYEWLLTE